MSRLDIFEQNLANFKTRLLASELYRSYLKADGEIYDDPAAVFLAKRKNEIETRLEEVYQSHGSEKSKTQILAELTDVQRELQALPVVRKYMNYRNRIKNITAILEKGILEPIKRV